MSRLGSPEAHQYREEWWAAKPTAENALRLNRDDPEAAQIRDEAATKVHSALERSEVTRRRELRGSRSGRPAAKSSHMLAGERLLSSGEMAAALPRAVLRLSP